MILNKLMDMAEGDLEILKNMKSTKDFKRYEEIAKHITQVIKTMQKITDEAKKNA